jgi:uncharacterized protein YkwD
MSKRMLCTFNLLFVGFCMLSAQAKVTGIAQLDSVKTTVKAKAAVVTSKTGTTIKSTVVKTTPSVKTATKATLMAKTTTKAKAKTTKKKTKVTVKTAAKAAPKAKAVPINYAIVKKPAVQTTSKNVPVLIPQTSVPMSFSNEMLAAVNTLRKSGTTCGGQKMPSVKALAWNTKLEDAAIIHVKDMDSNDNFSHLGLDGSKPDDRIKTAGYEWQRVGENIGQGYKDVSAAIKGWKESANHCKQMMSAEVTEIGAAKKGKYWCQTFAKQLD